MSRILSILALVSLLVSLLAACASPAQVENMAVLTSPDLEAAKTSPLAGQVNVERVSVDASVGGGGGEEKTDPFWTPEIIDQDFALAIVRSLDAHKLLSRHELDAKYDLTAKLIKVDQQLTGFDLVVSTDVEYLLIDRSARRTFYHMVITAPYKAEFSRSIILTQRLRMANEGSIRKNIAKFIAEILAQAEELK